MKAILFPTYSLSLIFIVALFASGCGQRASDTGSGSTPVADTSGGDNQAHGGWWCPEHGVPEEECSLCSSKAAKAFKAKGDWCEEHNRAESQCFECDPSRAEKFAKLYEAKYGKKPPKPEQL